MDQAVLFQQHLRLKKSVKLSKEFTRKCILGAPKFNLKYGPVGHWL